MDILRKWLKKGKKWGPETPDEVGDYCNELLCIPASHASLLPNPDMKIQDFVSLELPRIAIALVHIPGPQCFSDQPPNVDPSSLKGHPLPPLRLIEIMAQSVRQAILDGQKSVVDRRYKDHRLPLWTVEYWRAMAEVVALHKQWMKACEWVDTLRDGSAPTQQLYQDTITRLTHLGWNAPTHAFGLSDRTSTFTRFLGHTRVNDTLVDMMLNHILGRLDQSNTRRSVQLERSWFAEEVMKFDNPKTPKISRALRRYETHVAEHPNTTLYFLLFMPDFHHWIAFSVDFARKEISYGDSLHPSIKKPTAFIKKLQSWLKKTFKTPFRDRGYTFAIGKQNEDGRSDSFSCGLAAVNAIAHAALGDTLWSAKDLACDRMRWFDVVCSGNWNVPRDIRVAQRAIL